MTAVTAQDLSAAFKNLLPGWAPGALRRAVGLRWPLLLLGTVAVAVLHRCDLPGDTVVFAEGGRLILTGHWGAVFADPFMQAGPWQLLWDLVLVPTHRPSGPHDVQPQPGALPAFLLWDLLVVAGAVLGSRLLRRAVGRAPSEQAELAVGLAALVGLVSGPLWTAHTSQVAIPALWTAAAACAWRGRPGLAGVLVGVSVGWEPWGILAAPVLLVRPRWRSAFLGGVSCLLTIAATYVPFVATGHFAMFDHVWPVVPTTLVHVLQPHLVGFSWPMRVLQAAASAGACAAVVLWTRGQGDVVWLGPLAATLVRLLLDPVMLHYYWVAASVIAILGLGMLSASAPFARLAAPAVSVYIPLVLRDGWEVLELDVMLVAFGAALWSARSDVSGSTSGFADIEDELFAELDPELAAT